MDFSFTQEHEELRQTVRRFLEKESTEQIVRKLMETESGYDRKTWQRMASELSLVGLAVPEQFGGAGYGPVELAIVFEEMGRVLFCGPYLSTAVLATGALMHAAEAEPRAKLLGEIAAGTAIATLALAEASGRWDLESIAMRARRDGARWRLEGVMDYVLDGNLAGIVLVAARADDGLALFLVEGGAAGFERKPLPALDLTRKLARLSFANTPAERISGAGDCAPALERVIGQAIAMLAAEQAGGAQRCLEMSVEYAKTRLQFGRPIGSFQAIKHKCADLLVETEFARSAAYNAAFCAAGGDDAELAQAAHIAKSYCSEAYFHAAADNIQIHGGMGFTWEHPAHLYFKRARASSVMFGDPVAHRLKLAAALGA
ncbi:MAG TPA: acyl-CoA dehydrogenase family protein [Candidatus Binataceae bacterium]|nr:acyl-CoA dehydrogenase family protein [Candidatus Binataceae bacterium]